MHRPTLRTVTAQAYPSPDKRRIAELEAQVVALMTANARLMTLVDTLLLSHRDDDVPPAATPIPNPPPGPRPFASGRTVSGVTTITVVPPADAVRTGKPHRPLVQADTRTPDQRIADAQAVIQRTANREDIPNAWDPAVLEQERADFQLARNTYMEATHYGT